jgi:DNA-binding XRE family transcriptional regulator
MKTADSAMSVIARAVLHHRKKAGLSRRELAETADVAESCIYNIEKMSTGVRLDTLLKLFSVLNIRLDLHGPFMDEIQSGERGDA